MEVTVRKAAPEDSPTLAELMNTAGEGIPAYLWARMAARHEDPMVVGARRVAGTEGDFSYTNVHVATIRGAVAGMLLGYRLPSPYDAGPLEELPAVVRPLVQLESLAAGSWYVNAVATDPACRGRGVGTRLMQLAERLATDSGAEAVSLIVADANLRAKALYERLGYRTVASRAITPFPGCPHEGDWVLMKKAIS